MVDRINDNFQILKQVSSILKRMRNEMLVALNLFLLIYMSIYVKKFIFCNYITCITIISYLIFSGFGFLVICLYPNIFELGFLKPDYRLSYAFPIPDSENILNTMSTVNIGITLGLIGTRLINAKKFEGFSPVIVTHNKLSYFFGCFLFIFSTLYFLIFFYFEPTWPFLYFFKYADYTYNQSTLEWFKHQQTRSFFFRPSIMRQILQVAMPLSIFYLINSYFSIKKKRIIIILTIQVIIFLILSAGLLKNTPIILFSAQLFFYFYTNKNVDKKYLLIPLIFSSLLFLTNYTLKYYLPKESFKVNLTSDKNKYYNILSKVELSKKDEVEFVNVCSNWFSSGKVKINFSENNIKKQNEYNEEKYKNLINNNYKLINRILCRIFIGEMMDTYMIIGNEELSSYYKKHKPIQQYLKKIFGYASRTIYQDFSLILSNDLNTQGSVAISTFYEFFLLLGYFSIIPISILIMLIQILDKRIKYILNHVNADAFSLDPSFILLVVLIPQLLLKGMITSFFTGGVFSVIIWLTFKWFIVSFLAKTSAFQAKETSVLVRS